MMNVAQLQRRPCHRRTSRSDDLNILDKKRLVNDCTTASKSHREEVHIGPGVTNEQHCIEIAQLEPQHVTGLFDNFDFVHLRQSE